MSSGTVRACSTCRTVWYCVSQRDPDAGGGRSHPRQSQKCQKGHWRTHKPTCRPYSPNEVWGIRLLGKADYDPAKSAGADRGGAFQHVLLKTDDPVFTRGELCPVTKLYGLPILIHSPAMAKGLDAAGNQPAVYLRIEPDNGFAPMRLVCKLHSSRYRNEYM